MSHLDNYWGITVFSTSRMLKTLQKSECIFIDGTFRTAPNPYVQFISIHGLYHDFVIPLAFCLSTGKATGQYRQLLQHLKRKIHQITGHAFRPKKTVMDFEQSLINAFETELPRTKIISCYFHYTQSLWRHIQDLGLATKYRQNRKLKKLMRKVMALGFLPTLLVRVSFLGLRQKRKTRRLVRRNRSLNDWLDYVQSTYVDRNALFSVPMWNVFERNMDTRTNNHLEGTLYGYIYICIHTPAHKCPHTHMQHTHIHMKNTQRHK